MATVQELENALRKADAAGNVEDARALANAIRQMRSASPAAPPSFGNVQSQVTTTEQPQGDLAPSAAMRAPLPPTLEQINTRNRAYMASPQYAQDQQAEQQRQLANQHAFYEGLPLPARMAMGAGGAVDTTLRGGMQLGAVGMRAAGLPNRLDDLQAAEAQARQFNDATIGSDKSGRVGNFAGNVAIAAVPLSRLTNLSRAGRYASSAAAGAAMGGLQPTVEGESRGENVAIGGALGVFGQSGADLLVASGKKAAAAVTPELRALYQRAKDLGIHLTPAQLSDSRLVKRLVSMADNLPFSGAQARFERQQAAGNRQLSRLLGEDSPALDAPTMDRALTRIGQKFDDALADGMTYGRGFLRELVALRNEAASRMDDTAIRTVNGWIERVRSQGNGGRLSGRALQSLDQSARKAATGGGDRHEVAQEFRNLLHDTFARSVSPEKRAAWDEARRQYAQAMQLVPLVARNPEGGVPLAQLQSVVTATKAGKKARARGRDGVLGELASIGQRIKAPSSSGTAENLLASQVLNPMAWPFLGAAALTGRASGSVLNSNRLADILMREGRGQTRQALAPLARGAGVAAAPVVSDRSAKDARDRK